MFDFQIINMHRTPTLNYKFIYIKNISNTQRDLFIIQISFPIYICDKTCYNFNATHSDNQVKKLQYKNEINLLLVSAYDNGYYS